MVQYDPVPTANRIPPGIIWRFRQGSAFPSISISTSRSELKSRYVMVDDDSRESLTEAFDLQFASATAIGDLYRNAGISCTD